MKRKTDRNEIWKDVLGFEGFYQVSNQGRVRSISRHVVRGNSSKMFIKGQVLKGHKITKGYIQVKLNKNGRHKLAVVHRLVAEAFLPPPASENMCLDHLNMDKSDNRAENLEWVTPQENTRRAWEKGACDETLRNRSRSIYNTENNMSYPSIKGASKETGIPYTTLQYYIKRKKNGWVYA